MKGETAAYLQNAALSLTKADGNFAIGFADEAGRHAYYAAFHAAQALIFERTNKVPRTHRGIAAQFYKLTKSDPAFDQSFSAFLSASYNFKQAADYAATSTPTISREDAEDAILKAKRFVGTVTQAVSNTP
jgi:uncharacterized protein (UPF0332 family)